ncbi:MAG: tol-pal system protein YbgF, partial [Calditrichaeota bacterium]|nr:tol-pal system protein YbgF [Calditrichota bacterium]
MRVADRCILTGMLALLAWAFLGCYATKKQAMALREEQTAQRAKLDSLRIQNQRVMEAIGAQDASLRELRATMDYRFSQLDERIQSALSSIGQSDSRFAKLAAAMEEMNRRAAASDTTGVGLGKDVLEAAEADLTRGNYDLAEEGFLQFLRRYPASIFADDAQYGLAECYYGRQKYAEAVREYQRLLQLYPDGDKVPAALLKLGLCHQNLQNLREAKKQWDTLVEKYPKS